MQQVTCPYLQPLLNVATLEIGPYIPTILSSQVVSLPLQSVEVANFCAAMDTLIDQDVYLPTVFNTHQ